MDISSKKILIIDDEKDILDLLSLVLKKEGFSKIYLAQDGKTGLDLYRKIEADIILLDVMLPDIEGYEICKLIRQESNIPILFMSAKTEEFDRILGFALGGDDYITKPFSPKELAYRIKAQLRRDAYKKKEDKGKKIELGPFTIDEEKIEVRKNGELIDFKPMEYKLFLYFAQNPNQILSKEKIYNRIWEEEYLGYDNTIMVHIRRIRKKIEDDPSQARHIVNVKGLGYKFLPEVE